MFDKSIYQNIFTSMLVIVRMSQNSIKTFMFFVLLHKDTETLIIPIYLSELLLPPVPNFCCTYPIPTPTFKIVFITLVGKNVITKHVVLASMSIFIVWLECYLFNVYNDQCLPHAAANVLRISVCFCMSTDGKRTYYLYLLIYAEFCFT